MRFNIELIADFHYLPPGPLIKSKHQDSDLAEKNNRYRNAHPLILTISQTFSVFCCSHYIGILWRFIVPLLKCWLQMASDARD